MTDPSADDLAITACETGAATLLSARGELSLRTVPALRRALDKQLADRGRVLVDLSGLAVTWRPALELFPTAMAATTGWPAARLVLFGADPGTARLLAAQPQFTASVHVAAGEAEAVELLDVRPHRLSRLVELAPGPQAPKWGRLLVEAVHEDWELADVDLQAARMVVSELVSNAVLHAGTSSVLTVTLTGNAFQIGVRDFGPGAGPGPADARPGDLDRMGMVLVGAVCRSWGVIRHDDGKTVWAALPRRTGGAAPAK
jgi:anti-sigma regulatory factor (Ser/Thr protein kinase)